MVSERSELIRLPLLKDLTYREWHGFVDGLYQGLRWGSRQHDYTKEAHYWRSGYIAGTATRYALIAGVYWYLKRN